MRRRHFIVVLTFVVLVGAGLSSTAAPRNHSGYVPPARQDLFYLQGQIGAIRALPVLPLVNVWPAQGQTPIAE